MTNNDVLRSVRYMLNLSDAGMIRILKLADSDVPLEMMQAWLKKDDEDGFRACPDIIMGCFLNGLIFSRRGKPAENDRPAIERKINNTILLKKLRIAFELKTTDIQDILRLADFKVSQSEISAIFRKPGHKNHRECGDQILRNFLKGLTLKLRPPVSKKPT